MAGAAHKCFNQQSSAAAAEGTPREEDPSSLAETLVDGLTCEDGMADGLSWLQQVESMVPEEERASQNLQACDQRRDAAALINLRGNSLTSIDSLQDWIRGLPEDLDFQPRQPSWRVPLTPGTPFTPMFPFSPAIATSAPGWNLAEGPWEGEGSEPAAAAGTGLHVRPPAELVPPGGQPGRNNADAATADECSVRGGNAFAPQEGAGTGGLACVGPAAAAAGAGGEQPRQQQGHYDIGQQQGQEHWQQAEGGGAKAQAVGPAAAGPVAVRQLPHLKRMNDGAAFHNEEGPGNAITGSGGALQVQAASNKGGGVAGAKRARPETPPQHQQQSPPLSGHPSWPQAHHQQQEQQQEQQQWQHQSNTGDINAPASALVQKVASLEAQLDASERTAFLQEQEIKRLRSSLAQMAAKAGELLSS